MNDTKEERVKKVQQALANQKLEGGDVSFATKKLSERYIAGEISAKELSKQIKSRYGIK